MKAASWQFEKKLWAQGRELVCGLDEVGRGAWAGPVVTAGVVFPQKIKFPQKLFDSKMLDHNKRVELAKVIREMASEVSIGLIPVRTINSRGVGVATQMAFRQALKKLKLTPDFLLIDAFYIKYLPKLKQLPIVRGDQLSCSIAAASIVAKVFRDELMVALHQEFPKYHFDRHKGYGTKLHQSMIRKHGFSEVHRKSFNLNYLVKSGFNPDKGIRVEP
jgi:ribonuclease HII